MKLHGTCIQTHNIDKMVDFYEKVFGYKPTIDGGVDFRFLDNQLIVFKLNDAEMPETKGVALIYAVENVDLEFIRLKNIGIAENSPTDKPWGVRSFVINDPDGNIISFFSNIS